MSKKDFLAKVLSRSCALHLVRAWAPYQKNQLLILAYHRIMHVENEALYPFDIELISASPDDFSWQVAHLKRHYQPITFSQVIDAIKTNTRLPHNSVIITFDDGFDDNYHSAYKILKKHRVPATFFISTAYIGSRRTFWFDRAVQLLKATDLQQITLNDGKLVLNVGINLQQKEKACTQLLHYMKQVSNDRRLHIMKELETAIAVPDGDPLSKAMTWDQVKEMSDNGMEIGSHAVTHPILSTLDDASLYTELTDSKQAIQDRTGKDCQTIAYPVGREFAFNETVKTIVNSTYDIGCSYIHGANRLPLNNPHALRRLHVERYTNRERFEAMLALPRYCS